MNTDKKNPGKGKGSSYTRARGYLQPKVPERVGRMGRREPGRTLWEGDLPSCSVPGRQEKSTGGGLGDLAEGP